MDKMTEKHNEDITITIVQPDVVWNNIEANLMNCAGILDKSAPVKDLILLPEMFSTGFTLKPLDLAEDMEGNTVRWMKQIAGNHNCTVAGSVIIKENGLYYNRLICADPSGYVDTYDKRHLFRMEGEEVYYTPGSKRLIAMVQGWRISFQICYDLRFPVWSKNRNDYDVLVYVANWPARRDDVWNTLLRARAIENQSYVIGVNRVGADGNGISYKGSSQVIDPGGNIILNMESAANTSETVTLSMKELTEFRERFPVWLDWDRFTLGD